MFKLLDNDLATDKWNKLALEHNKRITIASNPGLYFFYVNILKLPAYYFFLKSDDKIEGLFATVKAGRVFISLPHLSYGGILWFAEKQSSIDLMLIEKLVASLKTDRLKAGFYEVDYRAVVERTGLEDPRIEVRSPEPLYSTGQPDKVVNVMNLESLHSVDLDFFKSGIRRKIRKAIKSGVIIKKGSEELIDDFASVYNRNMHRKGSPTLGRQFFEALLSTPGIQSEIFVAYMDSKPVGGAFSMWYNGYYENTWFSTLLTYNVYYVSYLLHWEMIKSAFNKKEKIYSMGRSTINSGTHQYKKQWPTEEVYLYFSTNCPGPAKLKNMVWAPKIWKHLPASVVDRLGPVLAKRIY